MQGGKKQKCGHTHTLLSLLLSITASAHVRALYEQIAANDLTLQARPSMYATISGREKMNLAREIHLVLQTGGGRESIVCAYT